MTTMSRNNTTTHKGGKAANYRNRRFEVQKFTQRRFVSFLISPPVVGKAAGEGPAGGTKQGPEWRLVEEKTGAAKTLMDPYEDSPDLAEALRAVDLYSGLKTTVRRHYNGQGVTNAWLKMYEMTTEMGLVIAARAPDASKPKHTHVLRAFCNAELPGAFICALNHYLCTWHPETRLEWVASSLYPDPDNTAGRGDFASDSAGAGEILGDYYGLYTHNPDRWLMTPEMRGDVTDVGDIRALVEGAKTCLGEVDLYTSDAGIGVAEDYLRQEALTARIHLGQTLVGLMSLRVGGVLVVKTYTFTHPSSISLIAVCASVFDHFYVTKPVTSRPANSEVYCIGLGFRGLSSELEACLLDAVEQFDFRRTLTPLDTPETEDTVASLLAAARQIHQHQQVAFLEEAVAFYEAYRGRIPSLRQALQPAARRAQYAWLDQNPIRAIARACLITDNGNAKKGAGAESDAVYRSVSDNGPS